MHNGSEDDAPILICLLGSFRLLTSQRAVPVSLGAKAKTLLYLLSIQHAHALPRDTVQTTLWSASDGALASQSLHSLVHNLHKLLGHEIGGAAPVLYADGFYRLNDEAGVRVDVTCFTALADAGDAQMQIGNVGRAMAAYERAVALYRGDLCECTEDSQAVVERECLRTRFLTLLLHLGEDRYARAAYAASRGYAQRVLVSDPCREDAHRLVMRCAVRQGERAVALRQYRLCEEILRQEFDVRPEAATVELYELVREDPSRI